jgi:hypothetical protein
MAGVGMGVEVGARNGVRGGGGAVNRVPDVKPSIQRLQSIDVETANGGSLSFKLVASVDQELGSNGWVLLIHG